MTRHSGRLLRVLGVAFGWAVIVGNTIGGGILRAPGEVAQRVPSYTAFFGVWIAGALYALLGAITLAELGAMTPESGGQTVYVRRAFGAYPGFAVAWSDWLSTCASVAAVAIVLVDAVVALAPALEPLHTLLACTIILAFTILQWRGIRAGSVVQLATSAAKAVAFAALIIACLAVPRTQAVAPPAHAAAGLTAAGIMLALQLMVFTYDGWSGVLYFSGEVRDPGRDIVRSMLSGVLSVMLIYLLVNVAFLRLIPLPRLAGDPMAADTAARLVFGVAGTSVIRALIAVSLLSAINAMLLEAARVLYAVGVRKVNQGGTPTFALVISTLVALAFTASGVFDIVITLAAFFFVANYTASFAALFWLRHKEPAAARPYKAWGHPFTTALVLIASLAFLIGAVVADARHSLYAIALLAVSYPVFRLSNYRERA